MGKPIPALSLQLELTFKALNEENIQHAKGLAKLDEKLEQLQERFAFGHITQELYEKFSAKLLAERQPLEVELEKVDGSLSNLSQYIEKSLLIASKLGEYWKEGDYNTKEKLQYLVFPEGVQYEHKNKAYRTDRVNVIFALISSLSEEKYKNKKGQTNIEIDLSGSVAGAGLEPATFGL